MKTIWRFYKTEEAEFAQSLLASMDVESVLLDANVNALGPGFSPSGVRLQVREEDEERALAALSIRPAESAGLADEGALPNVEPHSPPPIAGFPELRKAVPLGLLALAGFGAVIAIYLELAPLTWTHTWAELVRMGIAAEKEKKHDEALRCYNAALALNPRSYTAHFDRGFVFLRQNDFRRAIEDFTATLKIAPHFFRAYIARGHSLRKMGNYGCAVNDFKKSIDLCPGEYDGYNALAWMYATLPQADLRNGPKAVELATRACVLTNWEKWSCIGTLAAAEAETGDFKNAVNHSRQALKMEIENRKTEPKMIAVETKALSCYMQKRPFRDDNN